MIKDFHKLLTLLYLGLVSVTSLTAQQQAQFSLVPFQQSLYNPALIADGADVIFMGARNQWQKLDGAPKTMAISGETKLRTDNWMNNSRLGLRVQTDKVGIFSNQSASVLAARPLTFLKHKLLIGGGIEFARLNADFSEIILQNPNDPVLTEGSSYYRLSYKFGAQLSREKYYLGFAAVDGFKEKNLVGYPELVRHLYGQFGMHLRTDKNVSWHPGVIFKRAYTLASSSPVSAEAFLYMSLKSNIQLGAFLRWKESVSVMINIPITPDLSFSYAYDYGTNQLTSRFNGSHEFWIRFNILKRSVKPVVNPRNFMNL